MARGIQLNVHSTKIRQGDTVAITCYPYEATCMERYIMHLEIS